MPTNKNQHFVPKCYLRLFANIGSDGNSASVCLYNLDQERIVEVAPIKNQCAKSYFYGKDSNLESAIQFVEGSYAQVVRSIRSPNFHLNEGSRVVLRHFWMLQHIRTEAAGRHAAEMAAGLAENIGESEFNIGIQEAVLIALKDYIKLAKAMSDLKVCLVRNKSSTPFVTSDNPAIMTNRWHLKRNYPWSFGLGSAGLLTFLPLSPTEMCVCYDGDVYSMSHRNGWVDLKDDQDAKAFNQHQFLNCNANVYFHDPCFSEKICEANQEIKNIRPETRHRIHYSVYDGKVGGHEHFRVVNNPDEVEHQKALIHYQVIHAKPALWPKQISWRSKGVVYTNDTGVGFLRYSRKNEMEGPPFYKVRA